MSDSEQLQLVQTEHINLRVVDGKGNEVFFKIKRSTALEKLMNAYAERAGQHKNSIRFMFDGAKVRPEDTPHDLDMNDNDKIEVMIEQVGGFRPHYRKLSFELLK
ncbi:hypothetical protein O181_003349 [Austropuccinia psidii MF-1]|uniref:Ubiquitin-like domain-containing protein n=1 Tax=Austropuccinia psidii MF-1 TaxID=1389203 RepID=A0A9Q3BDY6_9BASI|nr:hypothetical protein [Austropuccinia psidii MF-1]